jgi:hypothetical protein
MLVGSRGPVGSLQYGNPDVGFNFNVSNVPVVYITQFPDTHRQTEVYWGYFCPKIIFPSSSPLEDTGIFSPFLNIPIFTPVAFVSL